MTGIKTRQASGPLGLPPGIAACLFDLDGVLTQTAKLHAAAWKAMFDDYLRRAGGAERRARSCRSTGVDDYDDVRRRQAAPRRRALVPRLARDRAAGGLAGRSAGRRDRRRARQPQERARAAPDARAGRRGLRGLGALRRRRCGTRACAARSSRRAATAAEVLAAAGIAELFELGSTASSPSGSSCAGKPAPDTFLAGGARARRRRRGGAPCSRTRSPASRPGRAGGFGYVVGVDRVGQAARAARARRRRRRPRPRRAPRTVVIAHRCFAVEPWALRETALDLEILAQTESLFALSNGHIGLRGEPRRRASRSGCPAPT